MKIFKNYLFNLLNQFCNLAAPIIIIPYISRVLTPESIGINAYTNSIISYFVLLSNIGINIYANKHIASVKDSKLKLNRSFFELTILKFLISLFSYALFLIFIVFYKQYREFLLLQSILIIASCFDISWFFAGIEDFKKIALRNAFIKIVSIIFIFIFVKSAQDLNKFILILSLSQLFGNLIMYKSLKKSIKKIHFKNFKLKAHFKNSLHFAIPYFAIYIYVALDKIMLGIFTSQREVGFYDSAYKIVIMFLSLITIIGSTMLPKASSIFAKKNFNELKIYFKNSYEFIYFLAFPIFFGLIAISSNLSSIFFGQQFNGIDRIVVLLSLIIFPISLANTAVNQYLIPANKTKELSISVIAGAVLSFILNLILIPIFGIFGAVFSIIACESLVASLQLYFCKDFIQISEIIRPIPKYLISALLMFLIIFPINFYFEKYSALMLQIFLGILIYFVLIFIFKAKIINIVKNQLSKR